MSKQTGLKFFYGEAIANRNVQVNLKFKNAPINSVLNEITRQANLYFKRENNTIAVSLGKRGQRLRSSDTRPESDRYHYR
ncbi:STN domain-containing protein [Parabacteroides distasonis]|uniref:STN domain-containing protein n=1 Tax=Parabacteroides distasonis TaxID=823 RepID=UPI002161FED0|nr:STN domain-containing protein [Parabacteroides distasonis]UVQ81376.1 STN domain-containing protein [Parabacteroides distasonis]